MSNTFFWEAGRETFFSCVCDDPKGQRRTILIRAETKAEAEEAFRLTHPDNDLKGAFGPFFRQKKRTSLQGIGNNILEELRRLRDTVRSAVGAVRHQLLIRRIRMQQERDARMAKNAALMMILRREDGGWTGTLRMPGTLSLQRMKIVASAIADSAEELELSFQDAGEPARDADGKINDTSLVDFKNPFEARVRMDPLLPGCWRAVVRSPASLKCENGLHIRARKLNRHLVLTMDKDENETLV